MNTLSEAIQLNNEGACRLNAGNTLDALHLIRRAVVAMKSCESSSTVASTTAPRHFKSCDNATLPSNSLFYVYNRPLLIPTNVTIASQDELDGFVHIVTTYLLFNLALACHQFGQESGTRAPLDRAMEVYHVVLRSQCHPITRFNGIMDMALLHCLALNNLAHLHYEQCDYDCCEWCLGSMEDVILKTNCLDNVPACYLSECEVEELKLNMVFVQPPCAAHAA